VAVLASFSKASPKTLQTLHCCIVATTLYYLLTPDYSSPRIPSCTTRDASTAFELGLNLLCLPVVVGRRVQLSLSRVLMRRLYRTVPYHTPSISLLPLTHARDATLRGRTACLA
jgi:hypothetical protein